jgi:AraC-like DNA-binding protein
VFIFLAEVMDDEAMRGVPWLSFFTVPPRQRPRTSSAEMRREILRLGQIIRREAVDKPRGWLAVVRLFLFYLLLIVNRYWEDPEAPDLRRSVPASNFARVMPAVTLVHDNPERDIGVAKAAAACRLHRSRFGSIFQQTMGVSFTQFHRRARLAVVAHLLITTDLPTEAIAEKTGFVDGSHLHRTFVQYYNCTPGQYRAQHRR